MSEKHNKTDNTCTTITVSMPLWLVRRLTVAARKKDQSRSKYIVQKLERALERAFAKTAPQP